MPTTPVHLQDSPKVGNAAAQGVWTIADQVVVSLSSFTATVIVGRWLGKEELGVYALGMMVFWLCAGLVNAVAWVPYTARACRLSGETLGRYRAHTTVMVLAMSAALCVLCLAAGVASLAFGSSDSWLAPLCFGMAPLCFTFMMREHVRRVGIADFRSSRLLRLDLPVALLMTGLLAVLAYTQLLSPAVALLALAAAASLSLPVVWRLVSGRGVSVSGLARDANANWGFGRWMLVVALAWLIGDVALRWLLVATHGMDAMGGFSAAFAVVMLVNPIILAMTSFARSWAARVLTVEGARGLLRHTVKLTLSAVALACLAMFLLTWIGDLAVGWLFGAEFADSGLVTLLAAGICVQAVAIPVEGALTAMELGKRMTHVSLLQLAAMMVVGAPLVYTLGPMGIGWAMIARCVPLHLMYWETIWKARFETTTPLASHVGA